MSLTLDARAWDEKERSLWFRLGAASALMLGLAYLAIMGLYATVGAPPTGGEAWLAYAAGRTATWWAIALLSVLTDLLFIPIAIALGIALGARARVLTRLATTCILLFVVLDLAVTWSNYAALISLAEDSDVGKDVLQAPAIGASTYASAVLSSPIAALYSIGILAVGLLVLGLVMRGSGAFGPIAATLGIATGIAGIVSVVGPLFAEPLGTVVILASVLTTAWVFAIANDLWHLVPRY